MAMSSDPSWLDALREAGPTRADSVARITGLARLLDSAVRIPGTRRTVGLDAALGLIPGLGDFASAALASYIIWEARRLGLPRHKIARMISNLALDTAVGMVPLVGDLFDVAFKANMRNLRIVLDHLEKTGQGPRVPRTIEGDYRREEERR